MQTDEYATGPQKFKIALLLRALGYRPELEQQLMSKAEAGQMVRQLGQLVKDRRTKKD